MLADDFENTDLAAMWPAGSGSELAGHGRLDLKSAASAALDAVRFYDLRDDHFQLSVATTDFNPASSDKLQLALYSQRPGYALRITRTGPSLLLERIENNVVLANGSVPYDPDLQRYWRIANANGLTTYETSPNGIDFTVQGMVVGADYVTFMHVVITASTSSNPGFFVDLDDVDGGTPSGRACAMTVLADRFDGTAIDDKWARSTVSAGSMESEHDGVLDMAFLQGGDTNSALIASTIYDLDSLPLFVELPQMVDTSPASGQEFTMSAVTASRNIAQFHVRAGMLTALEGSPTVGTAIAVNQKPYDPVAHRWWRFRTEGTFTWWETSPDAMTWTPFGSTNDLHGFDRTDAVFQIFGTTAVPGAIHLDNLNSPP